MNKLSLEYTNPILEKNIVINIQRLQLIFKVVERCNINCTYCYYFNQNDQTALQRPKMVSFEHAKEVSEWLRKGVIELDIPAVNVVFHGGEPMMMPVDQFGDICALLVKELGQHVDLSFSVQTNGTILTKKWESLFRLFRVHVGVSIDGNRIANDRYRLDFKGKSTYEKVTKTIKRLNNLKLSSSVGGCSTISVLDENNDYKEVYRHIRALGVKDMSFLLPDRNCDSPIALSEARIYGNALYDIFEEWLREDDPIIHVRHVREFLIKVCPITHQNNLSNELTKPGKPIGKNQIIVARSDGNLVVDDSLMPTNEWYSEINTYGAKESSMLDYILDPFVEEISQFETTIPEACVGCTYVDICQGGDLENRYSVKNSFNNRSVYCESYKVFYRRAIGLLVKQGYPQSSLMNTELE